MIAADFSRLQNHTPAEHILRGFFMLIDGLSRLFSLGYYGTHYSYQYTLYRLDKAFREHPE